MRSFFLPILLSLLLLCSACTSPMPQTPTDTPLSPDTQPPESSFSCSGTGQFSDDSLPLPDEDFNQVLLGLLDKYYQSIGTFTLQPCRDLFSTTDALFRHKAIWYSLIEIRKASPLDLRLTDYSFTLTVTDILWHDDSRVELAVTEDAEYRFADLPDTLSQQYDTLHTFTLVQCSDGKWRIDSHDSDDNPYYNFVYDVENGCDSRLEEFLQDIAARQTQLGAVSTAQPLADHPYDRDAAKRYLQTYIEQRNDDWYAYDDLGGNCQNFGSQVLYTGGIPMDTEGEAVWYWYGFYDCDLSWINVDHFLAYAENNSGYGLVADTKGNYYSAQTGDLLIMGDVEPRHTTVIADTITDENGTVVDYLLCSNTSNYRNFPASAYYYTKHWPVRICGWNE